MLQYFPDGFDSRFPGRKGRRVARVPLRAHGPYFEVSADGHEKLASSALRMGSVGFSIYGYKDKYTDFVLLLKVYPDIRTSVATPSWTLWRRQVVSFDWLEANIVIGLNSMQISQSN